MSTKILCLRTYKKIMNQKLALCQASLRPQLNYLKSAPIPVKTAKLMHHHAVTHPHDCTTSVREISKLAVIMVSQDHDLTVRDAAHVIFDAWLDKEIRILETEVNRDLG